MSSSALALVFISKFLKAFLSRDGFASGSRLRMSFFRLCANPVWMSLKNAFSLLSGMGQGWQLMWRMAESTFGAGLKWDGGMVATSFGIPNN